jgi:hypothetical protein
VSSSPWPQQKQISDEKLVRALARESTRRTLAPFFGAETTAGAAAKKQGASLTAFSNRVEALVRLGLLVETRRAPRGGRALRYFRTAADEFFIGLEAMPGDLIVAMENAFEKRFVDALLVIGAQMSATGDGGPLGFRVHAADGDDSAAPFHLAARPGQTFEPARSKLQPFFTSWSTLDLSSDDARSLQRDIAALLSRYQARVRPGARRWLTRWGIVPID